jgi:hypothetical protein
MAVATFQYKIFDTARQLHAFVTTDAACDAVISIIYDNSGKFVLFYTGAA